MALIRRRKRKTARTAYKSARTAPKKAARSVHKSKRAWSWGSKRVTAKRAPVDRDVYESAPKKTAAKTTSDYARGYRAGRDASAKVARTWKGAPKRHAKAAKEGWRGAVAKTLPKWRRKKRPYKLITMREAREEGPRAVAAKKGWVDSVKLTKRRWERRLESRRMKAAMAKRKRTGKRKAAFKRRMGAAMRFQRGRRG